MGMKIVLIVLLGLLLIPLVSSTNLNQLKVTLEHPFLVNGEWVPARDLAVGDVLKTYDGKEVRITNVRYVKSEPFLVYNFEDSFNNYIVDGLVVHNSNAIPVQVVRYNPGALLSNPIGKVYELRSGNVKLSLLKRPFRADSLKGHLDVPPSLIGTYSTKKDIIRIIHKLEDLVESGYFHGDGYKSIVFATPNAVLNNHLLASCSAKEVSCPLYLSVPLRICYAVQYFTVPGTARRFIVALDARYIQSWSLGIIDSEFNALVGGFPWEVETSNLDPIKLDSIGNLFENYKDNDVLPKFEAGDSYPYKDKYDGPRPPDMSDHVRRTSELTTDLASANGYSDGGELANLLSHHDYSKNSKIFAWLHDRLYPDNTGGVPGSIIGKLVRMIKAWTNIEGHHNIPKVKNMVNSGKLTTKHAKRYAYEHLADWIDSAINRPPRPGYVAPQSADDVLDAYRSTATPGSQVHNPHMEDTIHAIKDIFDPNGPTGTTSEVLGDVFGSNAQGIKWPNTKKLFEDLWQVTTDKYY
ncbi:MAG: hypothetical protein ISS36_04000 [Candidatus Aenigmarchaeota archaeon]|nr:hypothetical protein [Candidatus Aenigmarchaeota archaeon]